MAIVVPYDPTWPQRFQAASAEILAATYHLFLWLEHIGSTAKPTIDMMASVRRLLDGHAAQPALAALGYELADSGMRERLFFQRLARPGVSAHHLHAVTEDSWATRNGHPPPLGLIPLTCNEIQHLFAAQACRPASDRGHRLRWSWWRRRHQARARACHYRRQAAQGL